MFRNDGTPYIPEEVEFIKRMTGKAKRQQQQSKFLRANGAKARKALAASLKHYSLRLCAFAREKSSQSDCLDSSGGRVCAASPRSAQTTQRASISIDARKVENRISPLLYGQFLEFMYEGIKGGLHAELIRNRSFEEPPNVIGLSRNWERYPDDRNDDYALTFHWDNKFAYPQQRRLRLKGRTFAACRGW